MSSITITALVLFATTYILMMAFQKIRPYVAVASAVIFVVLGTIAAFKPDLFGADFFSPLVRETLSAILSKQLSAKSTGTSL